MILESGVHYPLQLDPLPVGWRAGYVGDFVKQIEPGFASGEHNKTGNGVPHLRPMNVDRDGKIDLSVLKFVAAGTDHRRLTPGDVLFNNTNSPELVGKTAVVNQRGDFAFSNHMTRIRFGEDVLPKFGSLQLHFLWMRGYFRYNCVKHVNQASISSKTLARAIPFIWAPVAEQERIVAEIEKQFSRLDEALANLKRAKANLKRYKVAVLRAAVSGRLVEGNSQQSDSLLERIRSERRSSWESLFKASKGARYRTPAVAAAPTEWNFPAHWEIATVEELTPVDRPCAYGVLQPGDDLPEGVPLVRVGDISDGKVRRENLKCIDPAIAARYPRTQLNGGEVLLTLVGTIGRAAVAPPEIHGANVARAVGVVPLTSLVNPHWVSTWFQSPEVRSLLEGAAHEVARKTLNLEDVRRAPVAIPPIDDQGAIVQEVQRLFSLMDGMHTNIFLAERRALDMRAALVGTALGTNAGAHYEGS